MAIDPVCGMTVDEEKAAARSINEGTTYYFCSTQCLRKFEANPFGFTQSTTHLAKAKKEIRAMPVTEAKSSKGMAKDPICGMVVDKATALTNQFISKASLWYNRRHETN